MQNYIDSCHRESEKRAAYPENSTANFENILSITVDSDSSIRQEKQNVSNKYHQVNPYDKYEANKIIKEITSKKVDKREQNNQFQSSPRKYVARNKPTDHSAWENYPQESDDGYGRLGIVADLNRRAC